jgi:prepilin-type N-terminal cleavage/methylation domain-containing protein
MSCSSFRSVRSGLTLVEVMMAMGIFAFAALALAQLTYQITKTADENIHQNTAIVMAQGYMEQICELPWTNAGGTGLKDIADDTGGNLPPTLPAGSKVPILLTDNGGNTLKTGTGGTLYNGLTSSEQLYLDQDQTTGTGTFPMTLQITPVLTDLAKLGYTANGVEITIYFTATYNLPNPRTFTGSLRTVHANLVH